MIPRKRRLSRARFEGIRSGNRASSPSFSVVFGVPGEGGCAVVVAKAVAKRAVARHLLKRRVFAILKPWSHGDQPFIVYVKKPATTLPFRVLQEELAGLLSRTLR